MDQIINVAYGTAAFIFGLIILWALVLGLKQIGLIIRQMKVAKKVTLSPEEASEIREAIDAYRMAKKAEKAAENQKA